MGDRQGGGGEGSKTQQLPHPCPVPAPGAGAAALVPQPGAAPGAEASTLSPQTELLCSRSYSSQGEQWGGDVRPSPQHRGLWGGGCK